MDHRRLGASGLSVSEISYGNWLTHPDGAECVQAALDAGITTFHTAAAWDGGAAEENLAAALSAVRRDDLVLCTGVFWPEGPGLNDAGLSRKHLTTSLHGSLRRLRTDYIDVYQLLRFDYRTPLEETFLALSDLVRQGKILYAGTAEWTAEQLLEARPIADRLGVPLIANQPHYSMLWRVAEAQVMPVCERAGIGQFASVALAQGVLTGKYRPGEIPPDSRGARVGEARPLLFPDLLERVGMLRGVADDAGLTMAQLALAWTLQHNTVASVVTGASTAAQVTENAKASGVVLDLDVLTRIDQLLGSFIQTDPRLTWSPPATG
ncbi:aldo/keto reductase [Amycolatopsis sp. BJA-103]|uniref:aldo/keto reductase n=1 Tax=Amycolatopsis sp. BJA-103 TaxID=1911175 RepID=UPI000C7578DB|nr:aldo/keto reductase [Amycolatopsis sp. BJA-103]AUI59685.1 aldo/keto reductase [Amycolatopsis sp. BJA-103]PNE14602.1 aldo/keto reductase [Amycolatopsis sp. BJA-103]